ncbi:MAG: extracellular solute-binding protein [Planctomycetota bacterium]|nr:MAG: extracellular solute-binding protein [Planctomycetota bacterium]KAB2943308.1 MAG: extracellular solute-binding protein [Phycisphaerae bacterium]MCQ3920662.1 hypothetical protein [Planctomycetota bacterium]
MRAMAPREPLVSRGAATHRTLALRLLRASAILVAGLAVAMWLFGDTWRHHFPAAENANATAEIRFAHFGGYEEYVLWREAIQAFEREHPRVRVRQEFVVGGQALYHGKLSRQASAADLPDVFLVQAGPFNDLADQLADVGGVLNAVPNPDGRSEEISELDVLGVEAFRVDGVQRALPVCGGPLLIYVNLACFDRATRFLGSVVPQPHEDWTIDEFLTIASQATIRDARLEGGAQFGFWHPRWVYYLPFLWSFGADVGDAQGWALEGGEAESALTLYHDLLRVHRVCPGDAELPQVWQDVAFLTGRVAMCVNGPWFERFIEGGVTGDIGRFDVLPIPRGPGGRWTRVTWDGAALNPSTTGARRRAAEAFLRHLLSGPVQDRLAAQGLAMPARRASLDAYVTGPRAAQRARFVEALAYSRLQPRFPRFQEVDQLLNRSLDRYLNEADDRSAREFLADLRAEPLIRACFETGGGS